VFRNEVPKSEKESKDTNERRTQRILRSIPACRLLGLRMEERPPIWRVAASILNKQSRKSTRGGPPAWGLGEGQ
jgi:hypothetical protein